MAKTAAALHILVKEEKLALDLLEQIKNGADFGKLAKKHSGLLYTLPCPRDPFTPFSRYPADKKK